MFSGLLLPDTEQSIVLPSLISGSGANGAGAADEGKMVPVLGPRPGQRRCDAQTVGARMSSKGNVVRADGQGL